MDVSLERVFFRLHSRSSRSVAFWIGRRARSVIECLLLALSFASFASFAWLHTHHVSSGLGALLLPGRAGPEASCLARAVAARLAPPPPPPLPPPHSASSAAGAAHTAAVDGAHLLRVRVLSGGGRGAAAERLRAAVLAEAAGCGARSGAPGDAAADAPLISAAARYLVARRRSGPGPRDASVGAAIASLPPAPADAAAGGGGLRAWVAAAAAALDSAAASVQPQFDGGDGAGADSSERAGAHTFCGAADPCAAVGLALAPLWSTDAEASAALALLAPSLEDADLMRLLADAGAAADAERAAADAAHGGEFSSGGGGSCSGGGCDDGGSGHGSNEKSDGGECGCNCRCSDGALGALSSPSADNGCQRAPAPAARPPVASASFLFAPDRGLLSLPPAARGGLGLRVATLEVAADAPCLGSRATRALLAAVGGYDALVLNALAAASRGRGFVQSEHNGGQIYALAHAIAPARIGSPRALYLLAFKLGTLCSAAFIVFASSSLVSFIFAQTQQRMLRFTVALQQRVRERLNILPLVAAHLIDSLVFVPIILGVLFFLFEFFDDQLLAFLVVLAVWASEIWSITSCRTVESMKVFPRCFALFMTWFHAYFLSYPFGYSYLCLLTTSLALVCCAFHLFNRYELPALEAGLVSSRQPRSPTVADLLGLSVPPAPAARGGAGRGAGGDGAGEGGGEGEGAGEGAGEGVGRGGEAGTGERGTGGAGAREMAGAGGEGAGVLAAGPGAASERRTARGTSGAADELDAALGPTPRVLRVGAARAVPQARPPPQPRRRVSGGGGGLGAQRAADDRTRLIYGTPARGGAEGGAGPGAQGAVGAQAEARAEVQAERQALPQLLPPQQRRRAATESSRHGLLGGWL